jgi:hypothetical protein
MGPFVYRGDSGSNTTAPFDTHSPWTTRRGRRHQSPSRSPAAPATPNKFCRCYMGKQWVTPQATGRPRNSVDLLYFWPLTADGDISQVRYEQSVQVYV